MLIPTVDTPIIFKKSCQDPDGRLSCRRSSLLEVVIIIFYEP